LSPEQRAQFAQLTANEKRDPLAATLLVSEAALEAELAKCSDEMRRVTLNTQMLTLKIAVTMIIAKLFRCLRCVIHARSYSLLDTALFLCRSIDPFPLPFLVALCSFFAVGGCFCGCFLLLASC
jgi:hypothetical protein